MFKALFAISDPWTADGRTSLTVSNLVAARDLALTALFELRGKKRVKSTQGGAMEMVESGLKSQRARDPSNVAILHRETGRVAWLNLDAGEKGNDVVAGAQNRMLEMLAGDWRFATEDEEKAAREANAAELVKVKKIRDEALEGPVNKALGQIVNMMESVQNKPQTMKGKNEK